MKSLGNLRRTSIPSRGSTCNNTPIYFILRKPGQGPVVWATWLTCTDFTFSYHFYSEVVGGTVRVKCPREGGGVLRYISDGDVRSPFLGLKFAI